MNTPFERSAHRPKNQNGPALRSGAGAKAIFSRFQDKGALGKGRGKFGFLLSEEHRAAVIGQWAVGGRLLAVVIALGVLIGDGAWASSNQSQDALLAQERQRLRDRYEDFWRVIDERRQRQLERLEAGDRYRVIRAKREEEREEIRRRFVAARDKAPAQEDVREKLRLEWEKEVAERERVREAQRQAFAQRQAKLQGIRQEEYKIPPMLELRLELDIEDLRE